MAKERSVFLAISEAERAAASFERPFSILYGQNGFTPHLVDLFAKEFMVARTFSWHLGDEGGSGNSKTAVAFKAKCKAEKEGDFSRFWDTLHCVDTSTLQGQFDKLVSQVEEHPVAGQMWRAKNFASALSKFYMVKCNWDFPPFDSHAAERLNIKGANKVKQAQAYYSRLDQNGWRALVEEVEIVLQDQKINLVAARVLDKYLIQNGFGYEDMAEAYASTQSKQTQDLWRAAACQIAPLLAKSPLGQEQEQ